MGAGSTYLSVVKSRKEQLVHVIAITSYSNFCFPSHIRHTPLLVDLQQDVTVDGSNDEVAGDVEGPDAIKDGRIVEGDLLRDLHHSENDDQVGTITHRTVSDITMQYY